jgi:hypothetical protein
MTEEIQNNFSNHASPLNRLDSKLAEIESAMQKSAQQRNRHGLKRLLHEELENASDATLDKALEFIRFLNYEERELVQDLADARAALEEAKQEGTVSLADLKRELGL